MGDPSPFLLNLFKVFMKTAGKEISKLGEGNEKHFRKPSPAALPEEIHRQFSLKEIKAATNNFDPSLILGRGSFGYVYKGTIDDGNLVAVKRLSSNSGDGFTEFRTEVQLLCQLRHQHLVSLIGSCIHNDEMILVYELLQKGSLGDHLYGFDYDPLSWKQRLEICIGAARGLHYLHTGAKQAVIHRDIKSRNFLLDDKWVPKLSDFGFSKVRSRRASKTLERIKTLRRIDTALKGTFGYLDPEYYRTQQLTEKSDVYSFGVVLFEVLSARQVIDTTLNRYEVNLVDWASRNIEEGTVDNIIDPYLKGRIAPECLKIFVDIAYECISGKEDTRPEMGEVELRLELALEMQEKADSKLAQLDHSNSTTSLGSFGYSSDASCNDSGAEQR